MKIQTQVVLGMGLANLILSKLRKEHEYEKLPVQLDLQLKLDDI